MGTQDSAEPTLASTLWDPSKNGRANERTSEHRLRTHCKGVDAAIDGGLDYGSICCISAEANSSASDITQALLVSHLLSADDASVTVIDTAQALDVRRLYQCMASKLSVEGEAISKAKEVLARLKLMKAFDFVGLTECVGELRDMLEGRTSASADDKPVQSVPRGTIPSSQEEEEMLDAPTPPVNQVSTTIAQPSLDSSAVGGLLIIDSITHVAAPLLKNNHAQGQALIQSFMRSLSHLTRTHNLCTIILNNANSNRYATDESPSAFSSCSIRPALGGIFTHMLDLHLLIHELPKTPKRSIEADNSQLSGGEAAVAYILEVLQDRHDHRVGRWAAFSVDKEGTLVDVV